MRTTHRCLRPAGALAALLALLAIPLLATARTATPTLTSEQRARFADAATDPALPAWQREVLAELGEGATTGPGSTSEVGVPAAPASAATSSDGYWTQLGPFLPGSYCRLVQDASRDRLLIYTGAALWELPMANPRLWSRLDASGLTPAPRTKASLILDPTRDRLVLFGGQDSSGGRLDEVWTYALGEGGGWARVEFELGAVVPAGRYGHSAIYDPVRDRMVVFGGYVYIYPPAPTADEVWALTFTDPPAWQHISKYPAPAGRLDHVAIYDPVRDRMIIHGGDSGGFYGVSGDCWAFSMAGTSAWTQLVPGNSPPTSRSGHGAVYDPIGDRMVIFGGSTPGVGARSDVWSLSLTDTLLWTQCSPTGDPGLRPGPAVTFDAARRAMVVAGGGLSTTYSLSLDDPPAWTLTAPGTSLAPARADHSAVVDPVGDRVIVFGGYEVDGVSPDGYRSDLWWFPLADPTSWVPLTPSGTPPSARGAHSAIYDPIRQRMIVFGGYNGIPLGDIWSLSLAGEPAWTHLVPIGARPEARRGHSAIYDPSNDRMVVFGGQGTSGRLSDVWALPLAGDLVWSRLTPSGSAPAARLQHSAIFDPLRQRMLVFGGFTGSFRDDTWELTLGGSPAWTELTPAGPLPLARRSHSAIYDPVRDRMVVAWGLGASGVLDGDLEALDLSGGTTWSPLVPFYSDPAGRYGHSAAYDAARGRTLTFGGTAGSSYFGDLWSLNWGTTVGVEPSPVATSLGLAAPVPNPFRAATALSFALPRAGRVSLTVHDLSGRVVRRLVDGERAAGPHTERWDGLDARGARVGAGVYFVHLAGPGVGGTKRVVLLH